MQSPPAELGADLLGLLLKNLIRSFGEADQDTISERLRYWVDRVPHGRLLLYSGAGLSAAGFVWHIDRPLRRRA